MSTTLRDARDIDVSVDDTGMVCGTVPADWPDPPRRIQARFDGQVVATVPLFAGQDGAGPTFSCRLPPVAHVGEGRLELLDAERKLCFHRRDRLVRRPLLNRQGLSAASVYDPAATPMFGIPWFRVDGAHLVVSGAHLPPGGDPSRLFVRTEPGVAFDFNHPLPGAEFGNHFWYWPNAHLSNFILTIDLATSSYGADPFRFEFGYHGSPAGPALRRQVWLPSDLHAFIGFPTDASQLQRVQTWSTAQSVGLTGYNVFRALETILHRHGIRNENAPALLDWGCGHGRVTRHFLQNWPDATVGGVDIDAENVSWCGANLLGGHFARVPLMPPTALPPASLDAVFGVSVMTHLTQAAQRAWLRELQRILKPGGLALLTFGSGSAAAWGSFWHDETWWRTWTAAGFDDAIADPALAGKIGDDVYYRHTVQSETWTRRAWGSEFEVLSVENDLIGNQCLAVLRRCPAPTR